MVNANWTEIVELLNAEKTAVTFRQTVENCLRILGWKKTNGSMSVDSFGDDICIVLHERENTGNLLPSVLVFVSNENQPGEKVSEAMSLYGMGFALQFSDTITLCQIGEDGLLQIVSTVIPEEANTIGSSLCTVLEASSFKMETLRQFYNDLLESSLPLTKLRKHLAHLSANPTAIIELIKDSLADYDLSEDAIEEELDKYEISFGLKHTTTTPRLATSKEESTKHLDTTKFSFDGTNYYNKRTFVLKVVGKYIEDHPLATIDDLERQFPSKIISKKRGVVRPLELVNSWIKDNPGIKKRFSLSSEDIITLHDGMKIVVNNQWGTRFPYFLQIAKSLYNVTSDKPYIYEIEEEDEETGGEKKITISIESLQSFARSK